MNELYDTIGTIAACAHANGNEIDENIRPEDDQNIAHGLDIYHRLQFMRIGKPRDEQRFEITSPYQFVPVLQNNMSDSELAQRVSVDLDTLSPGERRQAIHNACKPELREATSQYDAFVDSFTQDIEPVDIDLLRISYGDDDLWNGFYIRDHCYPKGDSFSIKEYRDLVSSVRSVRIKAIKLAHEVVDVFDKAGSEELADEPKKDSQPYQHSSLGFQ